MKNGTEAWYPLSKMLENHPKMWLFQHCGNRNPHFQKNDRNIVWVQRCGAANLWVETSNCLHHPSHWLPSQLNSRGDRWTRDSDPCHPSLGAECGPVFRQSARFLMLMQRECGRRGPPAPHIRDPVSADIQHTSTFHVLIANDRRMRGTGAACGCPNKHGRQSMPSTWGRFKLPPSL